MKKVLVAAFAGMCVLSSIMATTASTSKSSVPSRLNVLLNDTIPGKKDTTTWPKRDTTSMPKITDASVR